MANAGIETLDHVVVVVPRERLGHLQTRVSSNREVAGGCYLLELVRTVPTPRERRVPSKSQAMTIGRDRHPVSYTMHNATYRQNGLPELRR